MKKRLLTVLVTIITVIPLVLSVPKADTQTSTHTVTTYGDYTFQQGTSTTTFDYELTPLAINLTWNSGSWMKLDYNFKDKYSGTMKFSVTSNEDWILNSSPVYYSVYCDGAESTCYISSTTTMSAVGRTKTFSVIFTNATGIHFNVATGSSATFFTSSNLITILSSSFTAQKDITDVYTDIHQLRTWWDLYVPGMSTNLGNISLGIDSIEQMVNDINYYVGNDLDNHLINMDSNIQSMASDIALLKTYLDGVEGYIDQIEGYIDTLESKLTTISSTLTNIYNYFKYSNVPLWRYKALLFGNMMPTQSQASQSSYTYNTPQFGASFLSPYFSINKSYYDQAFTIYNSFRITYNEPLILVWLSPQRNDYGEFGHPSDAIRIYSAVPNTPDEGTFIQQYGINCQSFGYYRLHYIVLYTTRATSTVEIEFNPTLSGGGPGSTYLEFSPLYFGPYNNMPDEISSLIKADYNNTYTRLLQQIVNGISNIGGDYDTSQYDQYEQTIDGLNDTMRDRFNNSETSFQNNLNNILTPDQTSGGSNTIFEQFHFNAINGVFTGFLGQLFNAAPVLQYLLLFGLLLLVLGVFI